MLVDVLWLSFFIPLFIFNILIGQLRIRLKA